MQAEIICIGDELLLGQVVNTNAAWLSRAVAGVGLQVIRTVCVADDEGAITEALQQAIERSDWVFVTGGLGPTKDDVTKQALLKVFGGELALSQPTWDHLVKLYRRLGKEATDVHKAQAMQPTTATVLHNAMGAAPGLFFDANPGKVCVMPGVPFEMEYLMDRQFLPLISSLHNGYEVAYRTIGTVGEGETVLSDMIADIEDNLPDGLRIAYLPAPGRVRIRVTGIGKTDLRVKEKVDQVAAAVAGRLTLYIYAEEDISLAAAIGKMLRAAGKTLAVAESCTGGYLAHLITAEAGASDFFSGGAITYSNAMKQSVLGVKDVTLEQYGAVSEQTVLEMAAGAVRVFGSDYAIAVSGVAGPSGGSPEKPVGTVWIAIADGSEVSAKKFTFGKDRLRNIEYSAVAAMNMLRIRIKG